MKRDSPRGSNIPISFHHLCGSPKCSNYKSGKERCNFRRAVIPKHTPKISHLFFVEDNILFCKSNVVEWRRLMQILGIYENASG
jgi:hypothetical protein